MDYYGYSYFKVEFYDPNTNKSFGFAYNVEMGIKTAIMLSDDKTVQIRDRISGEVFVTVINGKVQRKSNRPAVVQ